MRRSEKSSRVDRGDRACTGRWLLPRTDFEVAASESGSCGAWDAGPHPVSSRWKAALQREDAVHPERPGMYRRVRGPEQSGSPARPANHSLLCAAGGRADRRIVAPVSPSPSEVADSVLVAHR